MSQRNPSPTSAEPTTRRRNAGRAGGLLAAAVTAGAVLAAAGPSWAAVGANSSAYALAVHKVVGIVTVPATPTSTYPSGGNNSAVPLDLGALGKVGVLNADTSGNQGNGTSTAFASAADVALLAVAPSLPAISADAVSATCSDDAPATPTGSTTLTNAKLGPTSALDLHPAANDTVLNVPGVAKVVLNQQSLKGGVLTVNAIHVQLGTNGALGDIVIGHVSCGPNVQTAAADAFSFQQLPLILGGIAVLVLIGAGVRFGVRRLSTSA